MTDLEIARMCAEAIELRLDHGYTTPNCAGLVCSNGDCYDPLHNDAQAMALVKKFVRVIVKRKEGDWSINLDGARNADLNRAVCECVAKMQKGRPI